MSLATKVVELLNMETAEIAKYKMRCIEIAKEIGNNNADDIIKTASLLYNFLEITFVKIPSSNQVSE